MLSDQRATPTNDPFVAAYNGELGRETTKDTNPSLVLPVALISLPLYHMNRNTNRRGVKKNSNSSLTTKQNMTLPGFFCIRTENKNRNSTKKECKIKAIIKKITFQHSLGTHLQHLTLTTFLIRLIKDK